MPLNFNGNPPTNINYNGNPLERVIYNGVIVWQKAPTEQTVAPTINIPTLTTTTASWSVLNNDASAAKVEARLVGESTWSYFSNVAAGTNSGFFSRNVLTPKTTYTIEARAQATGELMSEIITRNFTTDAIFYTVKWWTWDGEPIFSQQVEKGTTVNAYLPSPVRSGYTFTGWNAGSGAVTFPYTINDNTNFVGMHTITYYDVIWKNWDASTLRTDSIQKDAVLNSGNAPTVSRTGWTHTGWSPTLPRTITANTTFTAQYSINSYNVKWYDFEGSPIKTLTIQYGNVVQATDYPANPTFAGYTFTGWSQAAPFYMPANNVNITSSWTINTYTQQWNNWDGSSLKTLSSAYGSTIAAVDYPANPTRTGYTFTGWSKAAPYTVVGANTITAQFTINTYTVNWFDNTGANMLSQTLNYGTVVSVAAIDPGTKAGYSFTGWSPALPKTITADVNFIPQYTINTYTITWKKADGTNLSTQTVNYGYTATTSNDPDPSPTKTGHTFTGWSPALPKTITANTTFTPQYSVNNYTVNWFDKDQSNMNSSTKSYGTVISVAAIDPGTITGYTFTGWSPSLPHTVTGNVNFIPQYSTNSYLVTWYNGYNANIKTQWYTYGATVPTGDWPANPTRSGYTFNGWSRTKANFTITGNTTISANWTLNQLPELTGLYGNSPAYRKVRLYYDSNNYFAEAQYSYYGSWEGLTCQLFSKDGTPYTVPLSGWVQFRVRNRSAKCGGSEGPWAYVSVNIL